MLFLAQSFTTAPRPVAGRYGVLPPPDRSLMMLRLVNLIDWNCDLALISGISQWQ